MKTTAKANLLKANRCERVRPVALIQEKLARSRLIIQVEACQRPLLEAANHVLNPIIRQGHHALSNISFLEPAQPIEPETNNAWFLLRYHRLPLAWWRIDKCTLDQLASGYYGSLASLLKSPLRSPSQSEFRLAKKLMLAALNVLPMAVLDETALDLELVTNSTPVDATISWQLHFPKEHKVPPMLFCMTENLLGLMSEQSSPYIASPNLAENLSYRLRQIPMKILFELGRQHIPVTSLQDLKVGDIIPMNIHSRCPVAVGKRPIFYAAIHTHEGKMVAKLTQDAYLHES
ncbi:FliM/FliN family flagellar motor switch protein [Shewanella sp. VB17]|uniref:FliM/FliN family flagellar motor C-terminal domain-containing protein n=1 Tax=Shewanella sp. VB17 TaxID=2739432 RepID=UPI0015672AA1|nr:FliM/FliN family flagellar motor C-terminal domain-containing protein [Shewanella sp. VB17]NRD71710.1 FliM/FliN family flagellar motor switch protein [Shewanella sp. VB17]